MRIGVLPFALGASFVDLETSWLAAEKAGFASLWTVDHATSTRSLNSAWEASSLLVAMAARTQSIRIGVMVFDALLRHPFIVAGSVSVAQALSGGRVTIGVGVGDNFSKLDHDALGLPFASFRERAQFLEAFCGALPRLWRGESVTDPALHLQDASLGAIEIVTPPLVIGGGRRVLMEIAARHAQGWNLYTQDPAMFAAKASELENVVAATGRRDALQRSVYFFVDRVNRDLRVLLADFAVAGADEAILVIMHPNSDTIVELARQVL